MSFASEAGHWYTQDGDPMYEIMKADGSGFRPTTLRDARKLNLVPSVTTIMKLLAAPQLEMWKVKQAVTFARQLRKRKDETLDQFAIRAYNKSQEQVRERAADGSWIHGGLEAHYLGEPISDPNLWKYIDAVEDTLKYKHGILDTFISEKSFCRGGFGGKVDLHSENWVIDFKTKDEWEKLPAVYDNHAMQLAAYAYGLGLGKVRGGIMFVSNTAQTHFVELTREQLDKGLAMFLALRDLWYAQRGLPLEK